MLTTAQARLGRDNGREGSSRSRLDVKMEDVRTENAGDEQANVSPTTSARLPQRTHTHTDTHQGVLQCLPLIMSDKIFSDFAVRPVCPSLDLRSESRGRCE